MPTVEVDLHGPLFDGTLDRAIARGIEDARHEIGDHAVEEIRNRFDQVLRNPTGHLRSRVQARHEPDLVRIHNGPVPYRHWIEGVGSRNKTTRFKGYFTFRRIAQSIRGEAVRITARAVARATGGRS